MWEEDTEEVQEVLLLRMWWLSCRWCDRGAETDSEDKAQCCTDEDAEEDTMNPFKCGFMPAAKGNAAAWKEYRRRQDEQEDIIRSEDQIEIAE